MKNFTVHGPYSGGLGKDGWEDWGKGKSLEQTSIKWLASNKKSLPAITDRDFKQNYFLLIAISTTTFCLPE